MEILHKIMEALSSVEAQAGIIAVVVEFVLRMTKSEKPLGILHGIAAGLQLLGAVAAKAGSLLDKVLPQRLAAK
jgi:hypothetical protein